MWHTYCTIYNSYSKLEKSKLTIDKPVLFLYLCILGKNKTLNQKFKRQ